MSEIRRRYRKFTGRQKLELVMARLRGVRSIAELCREHEISETLCGAVPQDLREHGKRLVGVE